MKQTQQVLSALMNDIHPYLLFIYLWHLQLMEQDIWSFLFADRIVPDQETQHTGKEGLTPKQKLEFYLP